MCQIAISIPDEVLFDTKRYREEAKRCARGAVALGYYTQSGVSIGYCAQIAGITEEEFIKYLGHNQISIFKYDNKEEFLEELDNAYSGREFYASDRALWIWETGRPP